MTNNIADHQIGELFTKRVLCNYDLLDQDIMKLNKQIILNQLEILKLTRKSVIFENQAIIAYNVISLFKNRKIINVMVVSKTQSGKTGSMCATIKLYLEDTSNLIPIENIYIITGLSSCEWKEQTIERMPPGIQARVFHRCELPSTFVDEITDKKNILIIMDEIQVAAKKGQTIYNAFNKAGLLNKSKLYEHDIKILEYTATPDGTIYDLMKWKDASSKILAEVGEGYVSSYDLLQMGRVKQFKELCKYNKNTGKIDDVVFDNIREIRADIDRYMEPLYHIIRTKNGADQLATIENFIQIFSPTEFAYITYDKDSDIEDINKTLTVRPTKHTFIFIKEMLRCAKTLKKEYIGILYERYSLAPDDTTIIQGLVGRDTGYDNNGKSICYTNIDSITRYEQLWQSNFENTAIKWNSKTTKCKNGITSAKNTFNDPKNYDGFDDILDMKVDLPDEPKPIIKRKTFDEIKQWFNANLKNDPNYGGHGPKLPRYTDDNGRFMCMTQFDKTRKVRFKREFEVYETDRRWGFRGDTERSKAKNKYRVYPVYGNDGNPDSLEWWLIYY